MSTTTAVLLARVKIQHPRWSIEYYDGVYIARCGLQIVTAESVAELDLLLAGR